MCLVSSTQAMQRFIYYIDSNETLPICVHDYVLSIFTEYILLCCVSDSKKLNLNNLFESGLIDQNSKSVNQIKKDLKRIADSLTKAHDLIHTTKAGEIILHNRNKKVQESIKSIHSLSSLADSEDKKIEFQRGRGRSEKVTARIDMLSKLMFLCKYYSVYSATTQTGPFYAMAEEIYKILKIRVENLNTDMTKALSKHRSEKKETTFNFEVFILKIKNP